VSRNVAEAVKPNPPRGREKTTLVSFTAEEAALFARSTGMRRDEVVGLRWQDVDLDAAQAHVREIVADGYGGVIITMPKTTGSRRTVYLSPDAVSLLRGVLAAQAEQQTVLLGSVRGHAKGYERKRQWADSCRVFLNSYGGTLLPGNLTYASLALRGGVPVEVVSKQLGHASPAFTLTHYRTVFTSEREKWALNLSDLIGAD